MRESSDPPVGQARTLSSARGRAFPIMLLLKTDRIWGAASELESRNKLVRRRRQLACRGIDRRRSINFRPVEDIGEHSAERHVFSRPALLPVIVVICGRSAGLTQGNYFDWDNSV